MRSAGTPSNYGWLTPSLSSENELRGRSQTVGSMIRGRRDSSTFRGGGDKKNWDPQSKHFLPLSKSYLGCWDFIMTSATLQVMHDKNSLLLITWKISIQQSSNNETHEARLQCKFYWSSVIVFVVSWLFLRQTDSEFCQREIKMAGGWKKLSSCLQPRWKRLSSQLLLLLVTSCGQRPVSGYSTVSHHFSPMGKPFKLHIMSKMELKKLQIVQICTENGTVREAIHTKTLSVKGRPKISIVQSMVENSTRASRFLLEKWFMKPENVSLGHKVKRLLRVWTTLITASSLVL